MRIDKYLKLSRIIKRRTIANEACEAGRIKINDKVAKSGTKVQIGDIIEVKFGENVNKFKILKIKNHVRKQEVEELYEIL